MSVPPLALPVAGSPPPVRERLKHSLSHNGNDGITPARAGKTTTFTFFVVVAWDHPRPCGKDSNGSLYLRHFAFAGIQNLFNFFSKYQYFTTFTQSWWLLKLAYTRTISILSSNRFCENYVSYSIVYSSSVLPINLSGPAGHLSYEERPLQDVDQELQDQVGFVAGTDGDARGHEAAARLRVPRLVAADIEMARDFFGFNGVAVAVAGHTGSGDDVFIGTLFQDGVDEHGLGIGVVEGFANDLVVF